MMPDTPEAAKLAELVRFLKEIPECRLLIFDFVWKVVGENGQVDDQKVQFNMEELLVAKSEVQAYIQGTHLMVRALRLCLNPDL